MNEIAEIINGNILSDMDSRDKALVVGVGIAALAAYQVMQQVMQNGYSLVVKRGNLFSFELTPKEAGQ